MEKNQNKKRFYFCSQTTKDDDQPKGKLSNCIKEWVSYLYKAERQSYSFLIFCLETVNLFNKMYEGHSINKEDYST